VMSSVSTSLMASQLQVAVAKQQLDAVEQEGRNALLLIQASAPPEIRAATPPPNTAPGVGTQLNVVG
jgi:hypothetical protein